MFNYSSKIINKKILGKKNIVLRSRIALLAEEFKDKKNQL